MSHVITSILNNNTKSQVKWSEYKQAVKVSRENKIYIYYSYPVEGLYEIQSLDPYTDTLMG